MKGTFKIVTPDRYNSDEYLVAFYQTKEEAIGAIPDVRRMLGRDTDFIVKHVDPELISNPVATDYEHYLCSLIPEDEWKRVMHSDASAEIDCNNMTCGNGTYYMLSKMIPKDWTVIDFGCAYNPQSYLFQNHARHIAIEPLWKDRDFHFEYFKAPDTELIFMTGQDFIENELPKMNIDLDKTFAICNYVPSGACNLMVRENFKNVWCFYPA